MRELLLDSTLDEDAVSELTRLGITQLELLSAVPDQKALQSMLIDRIKWAGDTDKHIAKGLGLVLAWGKARERAAATARAEVQRASSSDPPILDVTERTTKMMEFRARNNAHVADKRPDDKLWDFVAACRAQKFLPYVQMDKLITPSESTQRTKKITKEDDGVEREKDVSRDRPPRGLWDIRRRIAILAVVADLE